MNYRILGKAIFKTLAWMIGGGTVIGVGMFSLSVIADVTKPWRGLIVLVVILLGCIGFSIADTYRNMIKMDKGK